MNELRLVLDVSSPTRLDRAVTEKATELSRSAVIRLIEDGRVLLNGRPAAKSALVRAGDEVVLSLPPAQPDEAQPEDIPLDIVYEDTELLVVNKPKGMVVHPAAGNPSGTLVNALLYHCGGSLSGIGGVIRPGIVHRIDKDTSGLLIVAKNDASHRALAEQIKAHSFERTYEAVACGHLRSPEGTVCAPIGRHPVKRKQMAVVERGGARGDDPLHGVGRVPWVHPPASAARNRAYSSNPGSHGVFGASSGRGWPLRWAPSARTRGAVPARAHHWFCAPSNGGEDAVYQ